MMNVVKMMGREIMGTQNLAERINEIRTEKNIAIDEIEAPVYHVRSIIGSFVAKRHSLRWSFGRLKCCFRFRFQS